MPAYCVKSNNARVCTMKGGCQWVTSGSAGLWSLALDTGSMHPYPNAFSSVVHRGSVHSPALFGQGNDFMCSCLHNVGWYSSDFVWMVGRWAWGERRTRDDRSLRELGRGTQPRPPRFCALLMS